MNTAGERPDKREPQVPSYMNNLGAIRRHYL